MKAYDNTPGSYRRECLNRLMTSSYVYGAIDDMLADAQFCNEPLLTFKHCFERAPRPYEENEFQQAQADGTAPRIIGSSIPLHNLTSNKIPETDAIANAVSPSHYKDVVPGLEYFDVMDYVLEDWKSSQSHALGNAFKYLFRLGKKDNPVQDAKKAVWYLERLISDLEKNGKK